MKNASTEAVESFHATSTIKKGKDPPMHGFPQKGTLGGAFSCKQGLFGSRASSWTQWLGKGVQAGGEDRCATPVVPCAALGQP